MRKAKETSYKKIEVKERKNKEGKEENEGDESFKKK